MEEFSLRRSGGDCRTRSTRMERGVMISRGSGGSPAGRDIDRKRQRTDAVNSPRFAPVITTIPETG